MTIFKRNNIYYMLILKISWKENMFPTIIFVPGKIFFGISTVISHYYYCMDTNTGEVKCELLCMTCACVACTNQPDHVWITG